jgi:oligopeptide/dipeptide ABC transporter ATP-binding protein
MQPVFCMANSALLEINNLCVEFDTLDGVVKAVDEVSYTVAAGETVAIVGESGSGKSVSALAIMGLLPCPPARVSGEVLFDGQNLGELTDEELRQIRGHRIGMVFQEPMTSLNPLLTVGTQLCEGMLLHLDYSAKQARSRAVELLSMVGISEPRSRLKQYPHEFSGGMRQRVMIAIALSCEPRLIIADEPTTALDVTIQAQVLQLMKDLTHRLGVALVLITHDLGIVARYANKVNVMYAGRIVECSFTQDLFSEPRHPYTLGLLASIPRLDGDRDQRLVPIVGQPPDLSRLDRGCAYRPRCTFAASECSETKPELESVVQIQSDSNYHRSACFHAGQLKPQLSQQ